MTSEDCGLRFVPRMVNVKGWLQLINDGSVVDIGHPVMDEMNGAATAD